MHLGSVLAVCFLRQRENGLCFRQRDGDAGLGIGSAGEIHIQVAVGIVVDNYADSARP